MASYPTKEQLKHLEKRGWRLVAKGLAWQSPYGKKYFYSARMAVVIEAKQGE